MGEPKPLTAELIPPCLSQVCWGAATHHSFRRLATTHHSFLGESSRLYRNEIFHPNTHFSAFFKIYRTIQLNFQNLAKFCKKSANFGKNPEIFQKIAKFCEISRNPQTNKRLQPPSQPSPIPPHFPFFSKCAFSIFFTEPTQPTPTQPTQPEPRLIQPQYFSGHTTARDVLFSIFPKVRIFYSLD